MVKDMNDFNLTLDEMKLYEKNINKLLDMNYDDLFNVLKFIMCKCPKILYVVDNY